MKCAGAVKISLQGNWVPCAFHVLHDEQNNQLPSPRKHTHTHTHTHTRTALRAFICSSNLGTTILQRNAPPNKTCNDSPSLGTVILRRNVRCYGETLAKAVGCFFWSQYYRKLTSNLNPKSKPCSFHFIFY